MKQHVIIEQYGDIYGSISFDTIQEARAFKLGFQEANAKSDCETTAYTEEDLDKMDEGDLNVPALLEHIDMHKLKSAKWFWG